MTIEICCGDMFASGADALVCAANAQGRLGAGQALEVRRRYPEHTRAILSAMLDEPPDPGEVFCTEGMPPPIIFFAFVKGDPQKPSCLEWVTRCAKGLVQWTRGPLMGGSAQPASVAVPALGCGLGGLTWAHVRPILERELAAAPGICWLLYEPREEERLQLAHRIAERLTRPGRLRANVWAKGGQVRVYLGSEVEGREGGQRLGGVRLGWLEVDDQLRVKACAPRGEPRPDGYLVAVSDLVGPPIPSVQRIHEAHRRAMQRHGTKGFPRGPAG